MNKFVVRIQIVLLAFAILVVSNTASSQWKQYDGPYGGDVLCIAKSDSTIFIGMAGGVYASADDGLHWQSRNQGIPAGSSVTSLLVESTFVFAATPTKIYRSSDGGTNWLPLPTTGLGNGPGVLIGSTDRFIYWRMGDSLYYSADGSRWSLMDTNLTRAAKVQCSMRVGNKTYFAGKWILTTTDTSAALNVAAVPPSDELWDIYIMAHMDDVLFAFSNSLGLLRSTDKGTSWIKLNHNFSAFGQVSSLEGVGHQLFAFGQGGSVLRSIDSGSTWTEAFRSPGYHALNATVSRDSDVLAGFKGQGFFVFSPNTSSLTLRSDGLTKLPALSIVGTGDTIIVGSSIALYRTSDHCKHWLPIQCSEYNHPFDALLRDGQNLWSSGGPSHEVEHSKDAGNSWQVEILGINRIKCLVRSGSALFAGGGPMSYQGFALSKSTDDGLDWNEPDTTMAYDATTLGIAATDGTVVAATTLGVRRSTDNGGSWSQGDQGIPEVARLSAAIASDASTFYLSAQDINRSIPSEVFVSSNKGLTWTRPIENAMPWRGAINSFASHQHMMFAGSDSSGVFLTRDSGSHWANVSLGLADSNVLSLAVNGEELLAGTSSGLWHRPLSEMISRADVKGSASISFAAYPNPSSQSIRIVWLIDDGKISAHLTDDKGSNVWSRDFTIFDGSTLLKFDGVASGAYRLQLQSAHEVQTMPILIQR